MVYATIGMSRNGFILAFTLVAVAAFWLAEWAEKARTGRAPYLGSPFLKAFSLGLVALAAGLFVLTSEATDAAAKSADAAAATAADEKALMESVEQALDHLEPEELADRLMAGEPDLVVVDVRPAAEFNAFHIRGALNVPLAQLAEALQPYQNKGRIVLYSNGMTHPAQARDSLQRQGFDNIYLLTDGLQGFRNRCLKPVSLRREPLTPVAAARVNAWRAAFAAPAVSAKVGVAPRRSTPPCRASSRPTGWRPGSARRASRSLTCGPSRNTTPRTFRVPSASMWRVSAATSEACRPCSSRRHLVAAQFSLLGLQTADTVVLLSGDKLHDPTLAGMAFERLGHMDYAVLNGGYAKWAQEGRPADAALPAVTESSYPVKQNADDFTVDFRTVAARLGKPGTVIIDVRPVDYYTGKKSDEARAGHVPGALHRAFTEDVTTSSNMIVSFKPTDALAAAYRQMIPSTNTEVIVHCRTGHQASQTYFVLKRLLGYPKVRWYDAGWTEWAARSELPIVSEAEDLKGQK